MSTATTPHAPAQELAPPPNGRVAAAGIAGIIALGGAILVGHGVQQTLLFAIGLGLGLALYHARFGFTSAFRQLLAVGSAEGIRAHALMLAAASVLFAPILSAGVGAFGTEPAGYVAPLGISVVVGAFLFGVGMQLGGACASGTLFAIGGGHSTIVLTLGGFIVGSVIGAAHWGFWTQDLAHLGVGPVSFADTPLGYPGALLITLALLGALVAVTTAVSRRRNPPPAGRPAAAAGLWRVVRGAWPLWVGAVVLAGLNALTLLVAGRPWGVTGAFALWGSKAAETIGVDVRAWEYWAGEAAAPLDASVLADITSVMNFGIILGALVAAAVGGTFALHRRIPLKVGAAAILGGILMGYGARLAFGCNIGAYFGGIASFSAHGWAWGALALAGTWAGLKVRPLFGLANPKPTDSVC